MFLPRFLKPAGDDLGVWEERNDVYECENVPIFNRNSVLSIAQQRQRLPIFRYRNHILYSLEKYQTLVILGETGCGKSTQIPQYLLEAGWISNDSMVGITQPRRIAATTLAQRVAEEKGTLVGHTVGYSIRFDDCYSEKETRIKYMTEGTLINEMMQDPLLRRYSAIMLDEIHERTLNGDIILGLLKKVIKKRPDLKLIVTSATFEAETIFDFLNKNDTTDKSKDTAVILSIEGRNFPVSVYYVTDPVPDYVKASVETVIKIHQTEALGDILVFLTGQEEVEHAVSLLIEYAQNLKEDNSSNKIFVLPLYGSLPMEEQLKVFKPVSKNVRKIVVATNIAEASVTIDRIVYVVDCCFVKLRYFNPHSCTDSLIVVPVSQAAAEQRAGRAGRVREGKAFRLCCEDDYCKLQEFTLPEMQRSNLAFVILQLKALGIENILRFSFPSAPPSQHVVAALEVLYALGALDESGSLTRPLGIQMAEFPLHAMFAKLLLNSGEFGCIEEALTISAMLQVQNIFLSPPGKKAQAQRAKLKFAVEEGDFLTAINVYNAFLQNSQSRQFCEQHFLNFKGLLRAVEIRFRLSKLLARFKVSNTTLKRGDDDIRKCIVSAFFPNAAYLHFTGAYKTVRGDHTLHIHPESVVHKSKQPQWVVFNEVLHTTKEFIRDITVIEPSWLYELAPHYYQFGTDREISDAS